MSPRYSRTDALQAATLAATCELDAVPSPASPTAATIGSGVAAVRGTNTVGQSLGFCGTDVALPLDSVTWIATGAPTLPSSRWTRAFSHPVASRYRSVLHLKP